MSVEGVILTAIIVVIINTVVSFVVANRFYNLTKKDSHIQSEIRALRRDIDDKFSGNVKQIKEKAVKVKNSNPDYSNGEEIKVTEAARKSSDDREVAEFARRWNIQVEQDSEPELRERKSPRESRNKSAYQPKRREITEKSKEPSKAKQFMGRIFPFDEED